jgi:transposase
LEKTMAKPSKKSADEKMRVLRGEVTATDAARRAGVSGQTVHNWKGLFLDSAREGLAAQGQVPSVGSRGRAGSRERNAQSGVS